MPKSRKLIPMAVVRALARKYQCRYHPDGSVLTVGIGFKRSRRETCNYGFGPITRPCLTALVRRKRPPSRLGKMQRFPKSASIIYRGKRYRIATDVEEAGQPVRHQLSCVAGQLVPGSIGFRAGINASFGSTGFVLRAVDSSRVLLITAGHVLDDAWANPAAAPIDGLLAAQLQSMNGEECWVPAVAVGPVTFHSLLNNGLYYDIGVVEVTNPTALRALNRPPWSLMTRIASSNELVIGFTQRQIELAECTSHGLIDTVRVQIQSVLPNPTTFEGLATYAPILIQSRAKPGEGVFAHGDSGAPLVDDQGTLYGLHVVGLANDAMVSYAVAADSIRIFLENQIGEPLVLFSFTSRES